MTLLAASEVSSLLQIDEPTLYAWRARRVGPPSCKILDRVVWDADELAAWQDQQHNVIASAAVEDTQ